METTIVDGTVKTRKAIVTIDGSLSVNVDNATPFITNSVKITDGTNVADVDDNCLLVMPYIDAIAHNLIAGHTIDYVLGYSTAISGTLKDISELGTTRVPIPATVVQPFVVSTSANDSSAGSNIQSVFVQGLDASYNEQSEIVLTNGLTPVQCVNSYIRFNGLNSQTGGTSKFAAGDITLYSGSDIYRKILTAGNRDMTCFYTVPNGKQAVMMGASCNATTGKDIRFNIRATVKKDLSLSDGIFLFQMVSINGSGWLDMKRIFPSRCDIIGIAQLLGAGSATVSMQFDLIIEA